MPKLLIQKTSDSPMPACGRRREVRQPHSRFQLLIDQARLAKNMTIRGLARAVAARPGATLDQSTLWHWLHNKRGYPAPEAFKEAHLTALAALLDIPEQKIRAALDESRAIYTRIPVTTSRTQHDALEILEEILAAKPQTVIRRTWVLNMVRALRAGAKEIEQ